MRALAAYNLAKPGLRRIPHHCWCRHRRRRLVGRAHPEAITPSAYCWSRSLVAEKKPRRAGKYVVVVFLTKGFSATCGWSQSPPERPQVVFSGCARCSPQCEMTAICADSTVRRLPSAERHRGHDPAQLPRTSALGVSYSEIGPEQAHAHVEGRCALREVVQ
jgi:hypothetical protein